MSDPSAEVNWEQAKQQLPINSSVQGIVTAVAQFGVFVNLGIGLEGLLLVPEMAGDNPKQMESYPKVGSVITATILWHNDQQKQFSLTQRLKDTAE